MDEAKSLLKTCGPEVDIILARDPELQQQSTAVDSNGQNPNGAPSSIATGMGPVERRRRRKLPPIERPRSAPIHNMNFHNGNGNSDLDPNNGAGLRTVIKIGTNSQSIEHHHHHIHHLGNGACVDNTPFMTPAQSVENFYNADQDVEMDDEALSVAGTEYSEAPSVARSYTISHHSNQVRIWAKKPSDFTRKLH